MSREVYRYVTREELTLMHRDTSKLGRTYKNHHQNNDFCYAPNQRYLHFFANKRDIRLIKALYKERQGKFYICTFKVPSLVLFHNSAKGYYEENGKTVSAKEYAIRAKHFDTSWIEKVEDARCFAEEFERT